MVEAAAAPHEAVTAPQKTAPEPALQTHHSGRMGARIHASDGWMMDASNGTSTSLQPPSSVAGPSDHAASLPGCCNTVSAAPPSHDGPPQLVQGGELQSKQAADAAGNHSSFLSAGDIKTTKEAKPQLQLRLVAEANQSDAKARGPTGTRGAPAAPHLPPRPPKEDSADVRGGDQQSQPQHQQQPSDDRGRSESREGSEGKGHGSDYKVGSEAKDGSEDRDDGSPTKDDSLARLMKQCRVRSSSP